MSTEPTESPRPLKPGDSVTCLQSGVTISTGGDFSASGRVLNRGDVFTLSQQMMDAAVDRFGDPGWPAIVHDEAAQLAKWGVRRFAPGAIEIEPWVYGDEEWREARERARGAAWSEPDHDRRAAALRAVQDRYGDAPATSQSHDYQEPTYWERAAAQQAERRAAGRVDRRH